MSAGSERDFRVGDELRPDSPAELAELLRDAQAAQRPVRLCGSGSRLGRLPIPDAPCLLVSTAALRGVTRLEPADLTCSVEPGLPRAELDAILAEHGLELGCEEPGGSVGGLFATGRALPLAPGGPSPRSLLLGLRGVLAEGLSFSSGSRVVKSVAGFDLQKVFVGSRGRLFAATELHLKLRRQPPCRLAFRVEDLDVDEARHRLIALLGDPFTPEAIRLERPTGDDAWVLSGRFAGARAACEERLARHELAAAAGADEPGDAPLDREGRETVEGVVRPSRIDELDELLPPESGSLTLTGGGSFAAVVEPANTDTLLDALPRIGAAAWIAYGAAARRGLSTPGDPGAERLEAALRRQLDPAGILR